MMIMPIVAFTSRLALLTLIVAASVTGLVSSVARAAQRPLPPLLYANNSRLYLFETNCADWLAICTDRDRMLLENLNQGWPVAQWSPDGEFIAVFSNDGWVIYRAECVLSGGECQPWPLPADAIDIRIAWGPDGSALAYMADHYDGILRVISRGCWDGSPPESCIEPRVLISGFMPRQPDWSANGHYLAFITLSSKDIYVVDMTCLDLPEGCVNDVRPVAANPEIEVSPSLSSDGSTMVYEINTDTTTMTEQLFIQRLDTEERIQITYRSTSSIWPDWSADDRYIAYAGFAEDGVGLLDVYVLDLPRGIHVRVVRNPDRDMFPNWGPLPQ